MNYLPTLIASVAICFGLQTFALHLVDGRTTKSESNFFSSVARIQTGVQKPMPEIFLVGSSLTGRFPSRSEEFPGVANLGCDGGDAAIVLRAIDQGILPYPETIVIEGNTLYRSLSPGESFMAGVLESAWFKAGISVPNLGATARPSAFAYSILLERKVGRADEGDRTPLPVASVPEIPSSEGAEPLPENAGALIKELSAIISKLRAEGTKFLIVQLPPGGEPDGMHTRLPYALSREAEIPILDLAKDLPPGAVTYTDGIHMAPASAAAALRNILAALEKM